MLRYFKKRLRLDERKKPPMDRNIKIYLDFDKLINIKFGGFKNEKSK